MKNHNIILLLCTWNSFLSSDPAIITYLQKPPLAVRQSIEEGLEEFLAKKVYKFAHKSPSGASIKLLKAHMMDLEVVPRVEGFLAVYKGNSTYSDQDGRVTFPIRHTPTNTIKLVITPSVDLIKITGHTFAAAEIPEHVDSDNVKVYLYQKLREITGGKKLYYWDVQEEPFPEEGELDPKSLILLTKQTNMHVQLGKFLIRGVGSNLIMPNNIYVVGRDNNVKSTLEFLNNNRYFDPIRYKSDSKKKIRQEMIVN